MNSSKTAILAGSIAGAIMAAMLMAKKHHERKSPLEKIIEQLGL